MLSLSVCADCRRHIRSSEPRCPFCGGRAEATVQRSVSERRWSRAGWLAFGAAVSATVAGLSAGCSDTAQDAQLPNDEFDAQDAGFDVIVQPKLSSLARAVGLEEAGIRCPLGANPIPCAPDRDCDPVTEYCSMQADTMCGHVSLSGRCMARRRAGIRESSDPFPAECGHCPTCECIVSRLPDPGGPTTDSSGSFTPSYSCQDIPNAGVVITHHTRMFSCGGCYGSPPARLERV